MPITRKTVNYNKHVDT